MWPNKNKTEQTTSPTVDDLYRARRRSESLTRGRDISWTSTLRLSHRRLVGQAAVASTDNQQHNTNVGDDRMAKCEERQPACKKPEAIIANYSWVAQ